MPLAGLPEYPLAIKRLYARQAGAANSTQRVWLMNPFSLRAPIAIDEAIGCSNRTAATIAGGTNLLDLIERKTSPRPEQN